MRSVLYLCRGNGLGTCTACQIVDHGRDADQMEQWKYERGSTEDRREAVGVGLVNHSVVGIVFKAWLVAD